MNYNDDFGMPNSVFPVTKYLTFGPWIYMVPQFKPESVLILGYCGGTVAGLIKLLYGDVKITGVDIEPIIKNHFNVEFVKADAKEYVKTCGHYDCVVVDIFKNNSMHEPDFVREQEFANDLMKIANYIILHLADEKDVSAYDKFILMGVNRPARHKNHIYYFSNKGMDLFPFKVKW